MEPGTKKKLLIGGSILVIASVGGYFLWKYLKNKKEEEAKKQQQAELDALAASETNKTSQSSTKGSNTFTSSIPAGTDILAFQKFANSKGEKLTEDGKAGPKTDAAWKKLGSDYTKSKVATSTTTPATTTKDVKVDASYFTDASKMIGLKAYAFSTSSAIYDLDMKKIGQGRKDEYLGTVTSIERMQSGKYLFTLVSPLKEVIRVFESSIYFIVKK